MAYLVLAVVLATVIIGIITLRYRIENDPAKSVDSFQRAIKALKSQKFEDDPSDSKGDFQSKMH